MVMVRFRWVQVPVPVTYSGGESSVKDIEDESKIKKRKNSGESMLLHRELWVGCHLYFSWGRENEFVYGPTYNDSKIYMVHQN